MITLIERAGEFSTKDIWHSTVQLITNSDDLHKYAATKANTLMQLLHCQELLYSLHELQVASWMLYITTAITWLVTCVVYSHMNS